MVCIKYGDKYTQKHVWRVIPLFYALLLLFFFLPSSLKTVNRQVNSITLQGNRIFFLFFFFMLNKTETKTQAHSHKRIK